MQFTTTRGHQLQQLEQLVSRFFGRCRPARSGEADSLSQVLFMPAVGKPKIAVGESLECDWPAELRPQLALEHEAEHGQDIGIKVR